MDARSKFEAKPKDPTDRFKSKLDDGVYTGEISNRLKAEDAAKKQAETDAAVRAMRAKKAPQSVMVEAGDTEDVAKLKAMLNEKEREIQTLLGKLAEANSRLEQVIHRLKPE
mmetsp:Transcript_16315/g.42018  ORF Transcript_16315/g.42018 Transcript_16315/m.42018 type:complete len:112 (+) Transcript_16315:88-423(+)